MNRTVSLVLAVGMVFALAGPAGAALQGYWPFDDGLPVTADLAGPNPGTLVNGPTYVAGAPGGSTPVGSLNFNGSNQYVDMGNPGYPVGNAITVSAWANTPANHNGHIVAQGGGWGDPGYSLFWLGGNIRVELQRSGMKTTCDNPAPSTSAWHHIAFTWHQNTDRIDVYYDGVLQGNQKGYSEPIGTPTMNLNVGRNQARANYFNGTIDDVAIWNGWLSAAEMAQLAAGTSPLAIVEPTQPTQPPTPTQVLDPITGHYFERINGNLTWDEARVDSYGRSFGGVSGHLATIGSESENVIAHNVGGTGDKWIGFHDSDQTSGLDSKVMGAIEGTFEWVNGETVTYTNWDAGSGEPNNSGGEDAAHLRGNGKWNDDDAGGTLGEDNHRLPHMVEYDTDLSLQGMFDVLERKSTGDVNNLAAAKALLGLPDGDGGILAQATGQVYAISFSDPDNDGGNNTYAKTPFLTDTSADDDDFALRATGKLVIPTPGQYTFAVVHDDDVELTIDGQVWTQGGTGTQTYVFDFATAGEKDLELVWLENGGGAYVQLFAAQGNYPIFNTGHFHLVGDELNGGLALQGTTVIPEPMTMLAVGLGISGLGGYIRKRRRA